MLERPCQRVVVRRTWLVDKLMFDQQPGGADCNTGDGPESAHT